MLELNSAEPYEFTVDGTTHTLPAMTLAFYREAVEYGLERENFDADQLVDFLTKFSSKETVAAIETLPIASIVALIKDWMGSLKGEAEGSSE